MRRRFGCGTARPRASDVRARRTLPRPRPSRTRVGGPIVAETGGFRFDWRRRRFRLPRGGVFRGVGPPVPGWRAARGPTALSWPRLGRRGECSRQDSTCAHSSGEHASHIAVGPSELQERRCCRSWTRTRSGRLRRALSARYVASMLRSTLNFEPVARTALYLQQPLRTLAEEVQTPNEEVAEVDGLIEARFRAPEMAEFLVSPRPQPARPRRLPLRHPPRPRRSGPHCRARILLAAFTAHHLAEHASAGRTSSGPAAVSSIATTSAGSGSARSRQPASVTSISTISGTPGTPSPRPAAPPPAS